LRYSHKFFFRKTFQETFSPRALFFVTTFSLFLGLTTFALRKSTRHEKAFVLLCFIIFRFFGRVQFNSKN